MQLDKQAVALVLITTLLTLYTISSHVIANGHLYEDPVSNHVYWTSGPSGSLFPWPQAPGMLEIILQVNEVDLLIYRYFIQTWALAGVSLVMAVITSLSVFRRIKPADPTGVIEANKRIT